MDFLGPKHRPPRGAGPDLVLALIPHPWGALHVVGKVSPELQVYE